jgi:hypothetical protein
MQFEKVLENAEKLNIEDKEILIEIINKRLIEEKRNTIFKNYLKAKDDLKKGNVERGGVAELMQGIK